MRRRRQYLSVLRKLTERQAKEAADRFQERIIKRENWYESMEESNFLIIYWIDLYCAFEVMDVRAVKGNG